MRDEPSWRLIVKQGYPVFTNWYMTDGRVLSTCDWGFQHNLHCIDRLLWLALHYPGSPFPLNLRDSGLRFTQNWTRP